MGAFAFKAVERPQLLDFRVLCASVPCLAMPWYQDATFSYHGCRCSGKALRSHNVTDTLLAGCEDSVILICMCYTLQIDVVEDAGEADALADHLDAMFAPDAPPLQWDAAGEYTRARLELYYLAHAAAPLGLDALSEVRCLPPCLRLMHGMG